MNKDAWKRYDKSGSWYYEIHDMGFKYNLSDVHAAIALEPHEAHDERLDFVIDVILGVAFGALVHRIWGWYFDQRLGRSGQPGLAYKWLLLLVMLLAVAT